MSSKSPSPPGASKAASREDRLKAALKANMGRRKAQARARKQAQAADDAAQAASEPRLGETGRKEE